MSPASLAFNKEETFRIARVALEKSGRLNAVLAGAIGDLLTLVRLVMAWAAGEYRAVPWRSILMALGALAYFVDPFDAMPDALPLVGYLDDASVIAFVAAALKLDIERFLRWERSQRQRASRARVKAGA